MTLNDIILDAQEQIGEVPGTPGYRDPTPWERHLRMTFDEICRRTFCYYTTYAADVTSGTAVVVSGLCSCPVFEIEEARLRDAGGTARYLQITPAADFYQGPMATDWRSETATGGYPSCLVVEGVNNMRLYPAPSYTLAAALLITGFATMSGKDGTGAYLIALTDSSPLPERCNELASLGAQVRRMRQYRRQYLDVLPGKEDEYREQLALLTVESRGQSRFNARVGA